MTGKDALAVTSTGSQDALGPNEVVRFVASTCFTACTRPCPCSCHLKNYSASPRWLKAVSGMLLCSYTGARSFGRPPCNFPHCQSNGIRTIRVAYFFPTWAFQRALLLSGTLANLTGHGASWTVRMPRLIFRGDLVWHFIRNGKVGDLQQLLKSRRTSPFDIDETGMSPLLVSDLHISTDTPNGFKHA